MHRYIESIFDPIHPDAIISQSARIMHYVVIEEGCEIGHRCFIGNHVTLRAFCKLGNRCVVGHGATFEAHGIFGEHVTINALCHMTQGIRVEDEVFFGPGVITMNTRHICYGRKIPKVYSAPWIKRAARIGAGAKILPGVVIGENALVAAGSIVTKDVPARMIVMGCPARIVGEVPENELL